MVSASVVSTESKLASSSNHSRLWLEKMTFVDLALHVGLSRQWRHKQVHPNDVDLSSVNSRLSRVILASTNECVGTTARIRPDGLCVSARHVLVDGRAFLEAKGWGEPLRFVASSLRDGIILLQGEA